jgi:hypothetical protein
VEIDGEATVGVLPTNSKGFSGTHMITIHTYMLFINVYLPFESDDVMTNDFADHLLDVEDLVNNNVNTDIHDDHDHDDYDELY